MYNQTEKIQFYDYSKPSIQGSYSYFHGQLDEAIENTSPADGKLLYIKNFIGMLLEELRYSCQVLKNDVLKDRQQMFQDFGKAAYSLKQLGEKIHQNQSQNRISSNSSYLNSIKSQNQALRQQNKKLNQEFLFKSSKQQQQIEEVKRQSYQILEQNFVLKQKITSLESEILNQTNQIIEDQKMKYQESTQSLYSQIQKLEHLVKQKQESISILERLVKDYQHQEKRNRRVSGEYEHSKILNMLSMESYDSRLRVGVQSHDKSHMTDRDQKEKQKKISRLNIGIQDRQYSNTNYMPLPSPISSSYRQHTSGYSTYRCNNPSSFNPHFNNSLQNNNSIFTHSLLPNKLQNIQNKYHSTQYNVPQQRTHLNIPQKSISKNDNMSLNFPIRAQTSRQNFGKRRNEFSKRSTNDQEKDNKIDLSKIERQLQGLSRQLKSELDTITKRK